MSIFDTDTELEPKALEEDKRDAIPDGYRALTLVTITGTRAFHYFRNDSTQEIVRVACTIAEYDALAEAGATQPSNGAGFTWIKSSKEPEYSGLNGDLNDDEYAVLPGGDCIVKIKEKSAYDYEQVKTQFMVGDSLDLQEYKRV